MCQALSSRLGCSVNKPKFLFLRYEQGQEQETVRNRAVMLAVFIRGGGVAEVVSSGLWEAPTDCICS